MRNPLAFLGATLAALAAAPPAPAQVMDVITFRSSAKREEAARGVILEESPSHVVYRIGSGNRTDTIAVEHVVDVEYGVAPELQAQVNRVLRKDRQLEETPEEERKAVFEEAVKGYKEAAEKLKASPNAARHLQYKLGRLYARRADADRDQLEPAIAQLGRFVQENPDAWQLTAAALLLGRLQEDKGDLAGAQNTYDALARRKDVPGKVRQECELLTVQTMIRSGQARAAERKLRELARGLAEGDPRARRLQVHLAECLVAGKEHAAAEKKLREVLASDADERVKGMAFNALGDVCRETNRPEDAFWNYLWVDVLYGQDKHEHAKAMYHLAKLFDTVRHDPGRALEYRNRLLTDKQYQGLEYQRRMAREK
jgi:tetratricopeptide (TPR) repeat protein